MNYAFLGRLLKLPMGRALAPQGASLRKGCSDAVVAGIGGLSYGGQLQQVRRYGPITGPPRYPLSMGQKLLLGWLPLVMMMGIPLWALFQIPRWSAAHNNRPYAYDEERKAAAAAAAAEMED